MRKLILLAACAATFALGACNTIEGLGRDAQAAGSAVSDAVSPGLMGPVRCSSRSPPPASDRLLSVTRCDVRVRLLAMSSIAPAPSRDGETVTSTGVIDALNVIGAGSRCSLANSSPPQPFVASTRATAAPAAAHGLLPMKSCVLTNW